MTDPAFTPFDRDEVLTYLGPAWPPRTDAVSLLLPTDGEPFTGAVAVWPVPGRPGQTWWAVDGAIPPQQAGTPDDALAALVPGSALQLPAPPPEGDPTPPLT